MDSTAHVEIHRSQFPGRLEAELADCLRARRINHKFHYESHKQVQRWLALHEAHSPARTDPGVDRIYEDAFRKVAEQAEDWPAVHVISLGCGGGQKDLQLLQQLDSHACHRLYYSPVDVSVGLTLTARDAATELVAPDDCHPLVCDLQTADDLAEVLASHALSVPHSQLSSQKDSHLPIRRIILFFGMLPNFEPDDILGRLGRLLRNDDLLLCSANLAPGDDYEAGIRQVLPQYDNAATREWLATLPNDLGIDIDPGDIEFEIGACEDCPAVQRIEATCPIATDTAVNLGSAKIPFQAGERLRLFYSCRYTSSLLAEVLMRHGLRIEDQCVSHSAEEGVYSVRKIASKANSSQIPATFSTKPRSQMESKPDSDGLAGTQ